MVKTWTVRESPQICGWALSPELASLKSKIVRFMITPISFAIFVYVFIHGGQTPQECYHHTRALLEYIIKHTWNIAYFVFSCESESDQFEHLSGHFVGIHFNLIIQFSPFLCYTVLFGFVFCSAVVPN